MKDADRPHRRGGVRRDRAGAIDYLVGTMIELPRAALRAGEIAEVGAVLLLRHQRPDPDHARRQPRRCRPLPDRLCREGHLRARPVRQPRRRGRRRADRASPPSAAGRRGRDIKLGICGEHGGDPASIAFCESDRPRLRQRLALSRADRPAGGGAGGAQGSARSEGRRRARSTVAGAGLQRSRVADDCIGRRIRSAAARARLVLDGRVAQLAMRAS